MVKEVVMTVRIRFVWSSVKVKDHIVDEAHRKSERVYSKGGVCMLKRTVCNFER